jgi:type I restriction enzyme S subunit
MEYVSETTEKISELGLANSAARLLPKGTVILSRTASVGFSAIMGVDMATTQDFVNWVCGPGLRAEYLLYVFRSMRDEFRRVTMGSTHQTIYMPNVARFSTPIPSAFEQEHIVAFIRRESAKIDALLVKKERLIELLQEKRTALITLIITKGPDANVATKESGIEWLGRIPTHWVVKRLWHLTPSDRRIMYGIVLPGLNVDDGVPIVKGGDVAPDRLRLDRLSRTTREIESGYVRSRLRGGDLVYAIRGSIGEVAIVPDELEGANLTQDAARIAYTPAVDGLWLLYTLKSSAVFAQLEAGALD